MVFSTPYLAIDSPRMQDVLQREPFRCIRTFPGELRGWEVNHCMAVPSGPSPKTRGAVESRLIRPVWWFCRSPDGHRWAYHQLLESYAWSVLQPVRYSSPISQKAVSLAATTSFDRKGGRVARKDADCEFNIAMTARTAVLYAIG